jgi:quinoprotein glucose dehydrogenase
VAFHWGMPLVNGVLVTGGGLVFTGAQDAYLRAFDAKRGTELWQGRLPVPGVANPMTYMWNGEQFVVIAAGGHSEAGTSICDRLLLFGWRARAKPPRCGRGSLIDREADFIYGSH